MKYLVLMLPIFLLVWSYNRPIVNAFIAGVYANGGITMAMQDWMGLAEYIHYIKTNWIDLPWGAGATIAVIAIWFFVLQLGKFVRYTRAFKQNLEKDNE